MKSGRILAFVILGLVLVLLTFWLVQCGLSRWAVATLLNDSRKIQVEWEDAGLLRLRVFLHPEEGVERLPASIAICNLPGDQEKVLAALKWLPGTITKFSIDLGNDPYALRLFDSAARMEGLEELMVFGASLDDSSLGQLAKLKRLRYLALRGNSANFESLPPIPSLNRLEIDATKLTARGVSLILENKT